MRVVVCAVMHVRVMAQETHMGFFVFFFSNM